LWTSDVRAALTIILALAASSARAQSLDDSFANGGGIYITVPDCMVYVTRVNEPPLVDWRCAEKLAERDGPGPGMAHEYARALIAVRDHKYEEKK
jgi:hypothetical protein